MGEARRRMKLNMAIQDRIDLYQRQLAVFRAMEAATAEDIMEAYATELEAMWTKLEQTRERLEQLGVQFESRES